MAPRRSRKPVAVLRGDLSLSLHGAPRYDFQDPYHLAVSLSWPVFTAGLLGSWLLINLLFAALYVISTGDIANARPGSFGDAFFFSIETLATVGYGAMSPATTYGHVISALEIVTGMAFTAIVTGLLFVRFSRPKAKVVFADDAVITSYNGRPTLMVRLANGRSTIVTSANARLFVLLGERTAEGKFFRRIHDLPVLQSHLPLFVMPWTLMHPIDSSSPLASLDAASMDGVDIRLFLTVEAHDQALAAVVHEMKIYDKVHILFGSRYADAVTLDETGHATADLRRISVLEPDA
jgi:inward rectifier potassium channel